MTTQKQKRHKLVAARIAAGYSSQEDFVKVLRENGVDIKLETYKNFESGRSKTVDVVIALEIARYLGKGVSEIFLPDAAQKIHRKQNPTSAA